MELQTKVTVLYVCSAFFITAILGGILYNTLWEERLISVQEDISNQLQHIDFSLNNFFSELESDVNNLVANEIVRSRNDRNFTNFLDADENTFQYNIHPLEKNIINIFNAYRMTHPYVNSVYMGRENGSSVRSHKRERPTRYDPRDRPWYILAKKNQRRVVHTDAYSSLTTPDINIGTVKALVDAKGEFYGVVGVDVTLVNIMNYISNFKISPAGKIFLTDRNGIILAGEDKKMHFKKIDSYSPELYKLLTGNRQGVASLEIKEHIQTLNELAIAKEHAEAADRLKSAFLATMSHELRTPLNSIIGFTGIILHGIVGPLNDEQKKQLNMVRGSAQHLLSLINDVLDISKIEAGQLQIAYENYGLRHTIEKAVESARPLADKKGLDLTCAISPEIETITGDRRRVEQILLNLISNAIKFTEKGSVKIECEPEGDNVTIRVIDTGIGIKTQDLETIFQAFRQIDSGMTRKYEGTGLGLSICKRLVELMGGQIRVTSVWGSGSTFSISLPKERKDV